MFVKLYIMKKKFLYFTIRKNKAIITDSQRLFVICRRTYVLNTFKEGVKLDLVLRANPQFFIPFLQHIKKTDRVAYKKNV